MISGTPRIHGLALGSLTVEFLVSGFQNRTGDGGLAPTARPSLSVKAAFVDPHQGTTHGWTTAGSQYGGPAWSSAVYEKLEELQAAIEMDLASLHFEDYAEVQGPLSNMEDEGLGEYARRESSEVLPG